MHALPTDSGPEIKDARTRINLAVKVLVERIEQIIRLRGGHLPLSCEDFLEFCCGLGRALGCQATNSFEFNREPQELRLPCVINIDPCHDSRVLGKDFDHAFFLQANERIPDRGLTDAELQLERSSRKNCSRDKFHRENAVPQYLVNLMGDLPCPVQNAVFHPAAHDCCSLVVCLHCSTTNNQLMH